MLERGKCVCLDEGLGVGKAGCVCEGGGGGRERREGGVKSKLVFFPVKLEKC